MTEDFGWEVVSRSGRMLEEKSWIGVRSQGLKLSAGFCVEASIGAQGIGHVLIKKSEKFQALLFDLLRPADLEGMRKNNPLLDGVYKINMDGGGRHAKRNAAGLLAVYALIRGTPWLRSIAAQKNFEAKRFLPERLGAFSWMIRFVSDFTNFEGVDELSVRAGLKGIYCLKNAEGKTTYIGQGDIKARIQKHVWAEHIRPHSVGWTRIDDEGVRRNAESHHIAVYARRFGAPPEFNALERRNAISAAKNQEPST